MVAALSYGFLHGGLLHLGMNMYALFVLGPLLEKMWGRAIFLTIYMWPVSRRRRGIVFQPVGNLVGASGAICGLLGSMATWSISSELFASTYCRGLAR